MKKLIISALSLVALCGLTVSLMACTSHRGGENISSDYAPTLRQIDAQGGLVQGAYLCGEELVYEVYFEEIEENGILSACLLYTSDAADER